jgi:hypothetical protein
MEMKRSSCLIFAIIALILTTAAGTVRAQSTNRDNPTPLTSNEVIGSFGDPEEGTKEYFYSFTAGPGDLTITFDLKGRDRDASGSVAYELLQGNGSEGDPILCCEFAQMGGGTTGRSVASVKLNRRQRVILHLTNAIYRGGSFNARFSGTAISFNGPTNGGYNDGNGRGNNNNDQGRGNRGDQLEVPSTGILHIRMKNGTTQDINLSRVREVTVRQ